MWVAMWMDRLESLKMEYSLLKKLILRDSLAKKKNKSIKKIFYSVICPTTTDKLQDNKYKKNKWFSMFYNIYTLHYNTGYSDPNLWIDPDHQEQ